MPVTSWPSSIAVLSSWQYASASVSHRELHNSIVASLFAGGVVSGVSGGVVSGVVSRDSGGVVVAADDASVS